MPWLPLHRSADQDRVLDELLATAPGAVFFDLDGCLLDNRPRQIHILREFAELHGRRLDAWALCQVEAHHFVDWHLPTTLRNAGLPADEADRLADQVRGFWWERFFGNDHCLLDHAMPGSVDLVTRLHEAGARVVYLTARLASMEAGTARSLQWLGYPLGGPRALLVCKPDPSTQADEAYKVDAARALGPPAALLDNEPTTVNAYRRAFPDALVVHLLTDHSGRPVAPLPDIPGMHGFLRTTDRLAPA